MHALQFTVLGPVVYCCLLLHQVPVSEASSNFYYDYPYGQVDPVTRRWLHRLSNRMDTCKIKEEGKVVEEAALRRFEPATSPGAMHANTSNGPSASGNGSRDMRDILLELTRIIANMEERNEKFQKEMRKLVLVQRSNAKVGGRTQRPTFPEDCRNASSITGQQQLQLPGIELPVLVFCEMEMLGGGWAVILNRFNGEVDFYTDWASYKRGFGALDKEFWFGFDKVLALIAKKHMELAIVLEDYDGHTKIARYSDFGLRNEDDQYRLLIHGYTGSSGDSLSFANGMKFSTYDNDNDYSDTNCAADLRGAGWFKNCTESNIFGMYLQGRHPNHGRGMYWETFRGSNYSLKTLKLLLRSVL